jgi:hypothetical protein
MEFENFISAKRANKKESRWNGSQKSIADRIKRYVYII